MTVSESSEVKVFQSTEPHKRNSVLSNNEIISVKKQKNESDDTSLNLSDLYTSIRKQIEYYLSDENLCKDEFFHKKISENSEGWLDVKHILSCKKIQALNAEATNIIEALKSSPFETKVDTATNTYWIRRTEPLPALIVNVKPKQIKRPSKQKNTIKSIPTTITAIHSLGVWLIAMGLPEEISWPKIKEVFTEALKEHRIEQARIRHVSNPNNEGFAYIYMKSFSQDKEVLQSIEHINLNNVKVSIKLIDDLDQVKKAIEMLPPYVLREREKEYGKLKAKYNTKPLLIAETRFDSINHLRKCYRELLSKTDVNSELGPSALKIVREILNYHPNSAQKTRDLISIKVGVRDDIPVKNLNKGQLARCFFVVRSDGSCEDFSIVKCLNVMMENPPLAA